MLAVGFFFVCVAAQQRVVFVAGGVTVFRNSITYSFDGTTFFAVVNSSAIFNVQAQGSCFSPDLGLWLIMGADNVNSMASSKDGIVWRGLGNAANFSNSASLPVGYTCAWGTVGGVPIFVAVGYGELPGSSYVASSPDGVIWTPRGRPVLSALVGRSVMIVNDTVFVGLNIEGVISSQNLETWTFLATQLANENVWGLCWRR